MDVVQSGRLPRQRVWALLGNSGKGNLGDEATFSVVIDALRSRCPDVRLAIFTDHPSDARERHGIEALPYKSCGDRKSTRLNSSHSQISYAVFCLKKKKKKTSKLSTNMRQRIYMSTTHRLRP